LDLSERGQEDKRPLRVESAQALGDGRAAGVGRGLGVGAHLPMHGVGVAVDVGVAVAVGVGVGVGAPDCAQYLPPVLVKPTQTSVVTQPPQTIISLPLHTAV
jgi:hypothetical protein